MTPLTPSQKEYNRGALAAATAFSLYGIFPIFWKSFDNVPVLELTSHRVLWTLVLLLFIVTLRGSLQKTLKAYKSLKVVSIHALAAVLLATNWLAYIWTTMNDRILEGALGYYILPFLFIIAGRIFLNERHSKLQFIAIAVAATGVGLQFPAIQGIPWAAFTLAVSFAGYGMLRKKSPLGSFSGLTLEASLMTPFALAYIYWQPSSFGHDTTTSLMLVATGIVTAAPLLFFASGARVISFSLLGILQFIGPTGQFLIGWLKYGEPLPPLRVVSFALIWVAVALYIISLRKSGEKISN